MQRACNEHVTNNREITPETSFSLSLASKNEKVVYDSPTSRNGVVSLDKNRLDKIRIDNKRKEKNLKKEKTHEPPSKMAEYDVSFVDDILGIKKTKVPPNDPLVDVGGLDSAFERIWDEYPRKDGKKAAMRHFKASVKNREDYNCLCKALFNYKLIIERDKVEQRYIKNGSTWFNNWRDWVNWTVKETEEERAIRESEEFHLRKKEAERQAQIQQEQDEIRLAEEGAELQRRLEAKHGTNYTSDHVSQEIALMDNESMVVPF